MSEAPRPLTGPGPSPEALREAMTRLLQQNLTSDPRRRPIERVAEALRPDGSEYGNPIYGGPKYGSPAFIGPASPPTRREALAEILIGGESWDSKRAKYVRRFTGNAAPGMEQIGVLDLAPYVGATFGMEEAHREGDRLGMAMAVLPGGAKARAVMRGVRKLPMDEASRLGRAKSAGFDMDKPLFHGTAPTEAITAFDPKMQGKVTGTLTARQGIWLTPDAELAARYAENAAKVEGAGGQQIMPLRGRSNRAASIALDGKESEGMIAGTIADAWDNGYDSVRFRHADGKESVLFRDPSQLRSPFARFDPAKRDSSNLLYGLLPPVALGASAWSAGNQGEAGQGSGAAPAPQPGVPNPWDWVNPKAYRLPPSP